MKVLRTKLLFELVSGISALVVLSVALLFWFSIQPASKEGSVEVVIPKGASVRDVARILHRSGVIKSERMFELFVRVAGKQRKIKAGTYEFSFPISPAELLAKLTRGEQKLVKITIPEGLTIREIDELLAEKGLIRRGELARLGYDPDVAKRYGIDAKSLEGFLFPDTYLVRRDVEPEELIEIMLKRFWEVFDANLRAEAESRGMSVLEAVTLASMIEKETGVDSERPLISAVFHNRLKKGMKLQCDPTVIYGLESFDGNLTKEDLKNPHPYNTYVHGGLPPGPICNPGRASLVAAVRPADVNYLYFVSRGDGTHYFSSTYSEHWNAVLKYQIKRR